MDKEEIIEKGMTKRDALNFLIVDETEAISGYDKVLKACDWDESDRIELERLRNAEIDHISDLSKIFNKHSTAKVVGTDSVDPEVISTEGEQQVQDARPTVKWRMHQAPSGYFYFKAPNGETYKENGIEVRFASKLPAGEFFVATLFNRSLWGQEVPRVIKDARAAGNVVKVDGGWAITSDKNWWTHYSPNGFFKFGSTTPEYRTVFKTEEEARKVAAKMLKEVYGIGDSVYSEISEALIEGVVRQLKSAEGTLSYLSAEYGLSESDKKKLMPRIKRVVELKDYQARGSFGSIGELKSHYAGASLRPKSDGMTVVLKSGAELEYSYGDGGTLVFIRGRN